MLISSASSPSHAALPAAAGKDASPAPAAQADAESLRKAVAAAQAVMKPIASSLEFSIDQSTGRTIVRVVDTETQQVIRQIPSKEMLEISRALERLQGLLLNGRA